MRLTARRQAPCGLIIAALALGSPARAGGEMYVGAFGGIAISESKTTETRLNLNGTTTLDGTFREVDFHNSPLFGAKAGYFFPPPVLGGRLGAELEFQYTEPHASRQTVTFTGTSMGMPATARTSIQHVDFEVYALLASALYRLPLVAGVEFPQGRVQPYLGVGGGAFIATMHTRTSPLDVNRLIHDTDVAPGLQALGGIKFFVLRNLAVFAEYRFVQTAEFTFHFKERGTVGGSPVTETARDRSDLTQHQAAFGVAVHW